MKKVFHTVIKNWITVWLVLVSMCMVYFVVFAEYIEDSKRAKRVIANTTGVGDLFSSDHLAVGGTVHLVPFGDTDETYYDLPVRIWNYDSANPTMYYDKKDITYTLVAQLMKKDVNDDYVVITEEDVLDEISVSIKKEGSDDSYTAFTATPEADQTITVDTGTSEYDYTIHQSYNNTNGYGITYTGLRLLKESRDENKFYIRFPKSMAAAADKIYVKLTATPTPSPAAYDSVKELEGILSITEGRTELSQGWSCTFNDSEGNEDYDGFNYMISGNGAATITFKWRDDKLEINPFFLSDNMATIPDPVTQETIGGNTWNKIIIHADSETKSRYDIQLYMKDGDNDNYSWVNVKSYVDYSIS